MLACLSKSFSRYVVVGCIGFLIDGSFLYLAVIAGAGEYVSRVFSICVALLATWWLHRVFTFRVKEKPTFGELVRYYSSNAVGAAVNYGVYCGMVVISGGEKLWLALGVASIVALAVNYIGARLFVFRYKKEQPVSGGEQE